MLLRCHLTGLSVKNLLTLTVSIQFIDQLLNNEVEANIKPFVIFMNKDLFMKRITTEIKNA